MTVQNLNFLFIEIRFKTILFKFLTQKYRSRSKFNGVITARCVSFERCVTFARRNFGTMFILSMYYGTASIYQKVTFYHRGLSLQISGVCKVFILNYINKSSSSRNNFYYFFVVY